MIRTKAYDELIDFLTSSPSPEQIVTFTPSPITQARVTYLLLRKRARTMTDKERAELDEFNRIEHLMRRLINEARKKISPV